MTNIERQQLLFQQMCREITEYRKAKSERERLRIYESMRKTYSLVLKEGESEISEAAAQILVMMIMEAYYSGQGDNRR